MNKQFKAVSMDCTQEQFESLRPHLEKIEGVDFTKDDDPSYDVWGSITNNYDHIPLAIGAIIRDHSDYRTYIGAFNPKAFIEACGGEWVEEKPSMKDAS